LEQQRRKKEKGISHKKKLKRKKKRFGRENKIESRKDDKFQDDR